MSFQPSKISRPDRFRRKIAATALIVSLSLAMLPAGADSSGKRHSEHRSTPTGEQMSKTLDRIDHTLGVWHQRLVAKKDTSSEERQLNVLRQNLDTQDRKALDEFAAIGRRLRQKHLPAVILQRQRDAVVRYKKSMATLMADLDAAEKATSVSQRAEAIHRAREHLISTRKRQARNPMDPAHLPTRSLKPNRNNKPKMNRKAFIQAGLVSNPGVKLAALGDFTYDKLPGASNPAYLAATPEVVLSDAIKAKAQELHYNPVKIYNWVHDNVEWVPSWGSLQGADLTLKSLQGNSIDTASLLIALYRASGIPARYVHGTIDVTTEKLKDWAGGFTDTNSVWDFVSSGGVPITAVTSGGKIVSFRMEHVWVEAAIDFYPSRGAINKSADSWVALDASFKRHFIVPGFDLTGSVPFDAQGYLSKVQNQNPVAWYMQNLESYLQANQPDKTLGQAMGYQLIRLSNPSVLPTNLPYRVLIAASRYGTLPDALRTSVQLQLSTPGQIDPDTVSFNSATLANKRFTLSYEPATSADQALVDQYGGDMYSVPPYLLYLTPTIKLDGQAVYKGNAVQMGQAQFLTISYQGPGIQEQSYPHTLTAGGYYAVGLDYQGMSGFVLGDQNSQLNTTLALTDPQNVDVDSLIGTHLEAMILQYFLTNDGFYQGAAKINDVAQVRAPSAGLAGFSLTVQYFLGIPQSASINKAQTDVGLEATQATSKEGNAAKLKDFLNLRGLMGSYSEQGVWQNIEGFHSISAVTAIQYASAQGVPVYTMDQSNASQIIPQLALDPDDLQEIEQGIQNGLVAIVPQHNITVDDWTGVGYIIRDPQTSAGVYRISGGLSGGSTTSAADGMQIVALFKGPFAWLYDKLDVYFRGEITEAAQADAATAEPTDEEIQNEIALGAIVHFGQSYEAVGHCTGLVIRAYAAAGISLYDLAKKYGIQGKQYKYNGKPFYVPNLYDLAQQIGKVHPSEGLRTTNDPLIGDIVFFRYTYDRNGNCQLGDDKQPTHVGIVVGVNLDGNGTTKFVAAGNPVSAFSMNLLSPGSRGTKPDILNSGLRNRWKCVKEQSGTIGPQDPYCPAGYISTYPYCPTSDFNSYGVLAGELFAGFGTVREGVNK